MIPQVTDKVNRAAVLQMALELERQGFSVVFVRGAFDKDKPKTPAQNYWQPFKNRRASAAELESIASKHDVGGVGIICGRVSNVVVFDCDAAHTVALIEQERPDLLDTFTVYTRKGLHLYFRPAPGCRCKGRGVQGVGDYKAYGGYAVRFVEGVETVSYTVKNADTPIRTLTPEDEQYLYSVLERLKPKAEKPVKAAPKATKEALTPPLPETPANTAMKPPAGKIEAFYQQQRHTYGRHISNFKALCWARDTGVSREDARAALLHTFVTDPAHSTHPPETPEQRQSEFEGTLSGVYSRPPRRAAAADDGVGVRLLQRVGTAAGRVLLALWNAGVRPGDYFTEGFVRRLTGFSVGNVVRPALATMLDGVALFASQNGRPPGHTHTHTFDTFPVTNRDVIQKRGRKTKTLYTMPDVRGGVSITMTADELRTTAAYRTALHREFIRRKPGQHSRRYLAGRLHVSSRTVHRYDRRAGIEAEARYTSEPLTPALLEKLPAPGAPLRVACWLETAEGRKRAPLRVNAEAALQKREPLVFVVQVASYRRAIDDELYRAYRVQLATLKTAAAEGRLTVPLPVAVGALYRTALGADVALRAGVEMAVLLADLDAEAATYIAPDAPTASAESAPPNAAEADPLMMWGQAVGAVVTVSAGQRRRWRTHRVGHAPPDTPRRV